MYIYPDIHQPSQSSLVSGSDNNETGIRVAKISHLLSDKRNTKTANMFRSVFNIRGHSFEDDDPASCVKMAARGIHDDEMSSFLTTNVPRDDEFIPNNHCDCDSFGYKPDLSSKVEIPSRRAKYYTLSDEDCISDRSDCVPAANDSKRVMRLTRSYDKIEFKGSRHKIQIKTKKSKSYDSAFGTAVKKEG